MIDLNPYTEFHFLRPWWLGIVVLAFLLWLILHFGSSTERRWRRIIASHLLTHLKVGGEHRWRFRPLHLVVMFMILGSVGAAGPTWEREASPFAEDTAPLVIALDLSASMNAIDIQPTRLERAKQKIRDLVALRTGARTALIAYAGSAHTVLPLSDDPLLFETFLPALSTKVMPVDGKDPSKALDLAEQILSSDSVPGSILFFTDGIAERHVPAFVAHSERTHDEVLVLAVGTTQGGPIRIDDQTFHTAAKGRRVVATLDLEGLNLLESETGAFVASVTVDDADVGRIQRQVQSHLQRVRQEDETARWKDQGYWLVFPVALLGLLWFRKGWTVRWQLAVLVFTLGGCSLSEFQDTRFLDLWLTPDQQGRWQFEQGNYSAAAENFQDPLWKGIAHFQDGNLEDAVTWLVQVDSPEASYNLGNAYAKLENYPEAITSYELALEKRPGWVEAAENLELIEKLIAEETQDEEEQTEEGGDPTFDPDEIKFDEKGKKGKRGEVDVAQLTDDQLAEMWMRRLQTSPADFLRHRFAAEVAQDEQDKDSL